MIDPFLQYLAAPKSGFDRPGAWVVVAAPLLLIGFWLVSWSSTIVRRLSSPSTQESWIEKQFDGKDIVEIYAPATKVPAERMAMIAYNRGYVFARSTATSRDISQTYLFRKLFEPPTKTETVIW